MIADRRTVFGFASAAVFLLAAWALFFWPILIRGHVPVYRDIIETTAPLGHYIGSRLRHLELPQWFPYEGLGEPFIGQLNESTFHPTSWLYAVLPLTVALRWELLLGYLVAAFGQFLLARRLGANPAAAALAESGRGSVRSTPGAPPRGAAHYRIQAMPLAEVRTWPS